METVTLKSGLTYFRDWDNEGAVYMTNPKTIATYKELRNEQFDADAYGVFFAFTDKQFDEGRQNLIDKGFIKEDDKIYRLPISGGFGIAGSYTKIVQFYDDVYTRIKEQCDPQEVYFYEYNNHECMFTDDEEAIKLVIDIWGKDKAHEIKRFSDYYSIEYIMMPDSIKNSYLFLSRLLADCEYYLGKGNRDPKCLWAGDPKKQVEKMRELRKSLPDTIEISEDVDYYEKKMLSA